MTFDPDIDPKLWKAEKAAWIAAVKHYQTLAEHEIKQHQKYRKLYFDMKDKRDAANERIEELRIKLERCQMDVDASH